jgi:hypothetical protein
MSGGHLLAASLDGGDTMISSSPVVSTKPLKTNGFQGYFLFCFKNQTSCLHADFSERHEV